MKYIITGGAGHISKPIAEQLLAAGHKVVVIGRSAENLQPITEQGAIAAIGSLEDVDFLAETFKDADAAYLMIPPNMSAENMRHFQNTIARNYIQALEVSGLKKVVVLSSIGAHMRNGAGPIDGLADFEVLLEKTNGIDIKLLRPSYFYYNLFGMIPLIHTMSIMGGNYGGTAEKLVLADTADIAAVAVEELLSLAFTGTTVRYIASDERTTEEIAHVLGTAVGHPDIPWVVFNDEQTLEGMKQAGFNESIAEAYTSMGNAIREGKIQQDYWKNQPVLGKVKLEDFAAVFAAAFQES